MEKITFYIVLKDCTIFKKEDETHMTGSYFGEDLTELLKTLDNFDQITSSHLFRVLTSKIDEEKESSFISLKSSFPVHFGEPSPEEKNPFREVFPDETLKCDVTVRVTARATKHTEKGKTNYYLALFPQAATLPADWREKTVNYFDGFR